MTFPSAASAMRSTAEAAHPMPRSLSLPDAAQRLREGTSRMSAKISPSVSPEIFATVAGSSPSASMLRARRRLVLILGIASNSHCIPHPTIPVRGTLSVVNGCRAGFQIPVRGIHIQRLANALTDLLCNPSRVGCSKNGLFFFIGVR